MKRILFVCTGNTCRSPMAKGLCEAKLIQMNIDDVEVLSAGIMPPKGATASQNAVQAMAEFGIDICGHSTLPVTRELIDRCDIILAMTPTHVALLKELCSDCKDKIKTISETGISDPFGQDLESYRLCRDELKTAIENYINMTFGG